MLHLFSKLKTGFLDDVIRDFSLALPPWVISHYMYTMLYKYGKHMYDFWGRFYFYLRSVFYI